MIYHVNLLWQGYGREGLALVSYSDRSENDNGDHGNDLVLDKDLEDSA